MTAGVGVIQALGRGWAFRSSSVARLRARLRTPCRPVWLAFGAYLLLSHLAAAAVFWHSSWPGFLAWKFGISPHWVEFDTFYRNRSAKLRRFAAAIEPGAALFVGDSLLGSLDVGALADRAVQLSISGDTTKRVAARMADYAFLRDTRLVMLHVGTNDLRYRPPASIEAPFARLLNDIPLSIPVIVSAILPVDERIFHRYGNDAVNTANRILASVCEARPSCRFVDTGAILTDSSGNLDPRYHDPTDGLHLNAAGVRAWQRALGPILANWRAPEGGIGRQWRRR